MPNLTDRLTKRAARVMSYAFEEAQRFNHNYLGTEHILLGLVREQEGVAGRVLAQMGVQIEPVRREIEQIVGRGPEPAAGETKPTPRTKRVLEYAEQEAKRLYHPFVGTEHLLLGLVKEGDGIAAGVLDRLGVPLPSVKVRVEDVLRSSDGSDGGSSAEALPTVPAEVSSLAVRQIITMFDYSLWARDRILGAMQGLGDGDFRRVPDGGVYGSIQDTLAHAASSQWMWVERCRGKSPMKIPRGEDFRSLTALIEWWDGVHAEAMQYLNSLDDALLQEEKVYTGPDGKERTRPVWHMLAQVTNHHTEHRTQIACLLGQMGREVPATDLVIYFSERGSGDARQR